MSLEYWVIVLSVRSARFCPRFFFSVTSIDKRNIHYPLIHGPQLEKTCLRGFVNNKGADQPMHPHSLISAFVICVLESIKSRLLREKPLVSIAEQAGLNHTLWETPKIGFFAPQPI